MKKLINYHNGFTLIELMITVVVIAILGMITIPIYQNYLIKAKVTEGLSLSAPAKTAVEENAFNGNLLNSGWVAPSATAIVSSMSIDPNNGDITITYTDRIASGSPTLVLVPVDSGSHSLVGSQALTLGNSIAWQCHSANPPLDNVFRDRAGTISPSLVPSNCRA